MEDHLIPGKNPISTCVMDTGNRLVQAFKEIYDVNGGKVSGEEALTLALNVAGNILAVSADYMSTGTPKAREEFFVWYANELIQNVDRCFEALDAARGPCTCGGDHGKGLQ